MDLPGFGKRPIGLFDTPPPEDFAGVDYVEVQPNFATRSLKWIQDEMDDAIDFLQGVFPF